MRGKALTRPGPDTILLFLILLAGTFLRLYRPGEIPFTHDEFSALFRTRFDSFAELIREGVMVDVHPAGVQVLLYYWVRIFGEGELAVKFPFILAGIASVYLIYRIGGEWYNRTVGLIGAAFMAAMEYTVMYSQIARPYSSGLFLSLLMALAWTRFLFRPGKHPWFHLALYVMAGSLCTYNHHFSLLFTALVGLTGLFFLGRETRLPYLLAQVVIILLYLPHTGIFFHQLGMGGAEGWLAKPGNDYIVNYIAYLFHYSWVVYILVAGIVAAGILDRFSGRGTSARDTAPAGHKLSGNHRGRFLLVSAAWFLIPFLTGFLYSRYVNAVLQFSVLIFSFPWFIFLVFGLVPEWKAWKKTVAVMLIMGSLAGTLIFTRQYYHLFYRDRLRELVLETGKTIQGLGPEQCLVVMDSHRRISEHYYNAMDIRFDHIHYDDLGGAGGFDTLLQGSDHEYLSLACDSEADLVLPNIARNYFPRMEKKIDYYGGNYYVFSRRQESPEGYYRRFLQEFSPPGGNWTGIDTSRISDTAGYHDHASYLLDSSQEYGPVFSRELSGLAEHKNDLIDISVAVRDIDSTNTSLLVASLRNRRGQVSWTASLFEWYACEDGWYRVYHTFRPDLEPERKGMILDVYIWNKDLNRYYIDDIRVDSRPGNRVLYGLLEKI